MRMWTVAATITLVALVGSEAAPPVHSAATATQAVAIAHDLARGTSAGHGPFHAELSGGDWRVTSGPPSSLWAVTIDAKTGRARTGFHQVVTVNEPIR